MDINTTEQYKEENRNIKWTEGVGEFLGFAIIVPLMLILVCAVFSAAQITTATERLSYAAYAVCRAAVVSESEEYAQRRAEAVMESMYGRYSKGASFAGTARDGRVDTIPILKPNEAYCELAFVGAGAMWTKGDMIECMVYQYVKPITPFTAGIRSQKLIMMIEHAAESEEEASAFE